MDAEGAFLGGFASFRVSAKYESFEPQEGRVIAQVVYAFVESLPGFSELTGLLRL